MAIRMLKDVPRREIYEAGDKTGKRGCGSYFVTYSEGDSPELRQDDIDALLKGGVIRAIYPGCYVLT